MRLSDYEPHWVNLPQAAPGVKFYIGVSFLCPHCDHSPCPTCGSHRGKRMAFRFWPPIDPANLLDLMDHYPHAGFHTRTAGDTFDTLTIFEGIGFDQHWHGKIINGEIT